MFQTLLNNDNNKLYAHPANVVETSAAVFWERELRLHVPAAGCGPVLHGFNQPAADCQTSLQKYSGNGDGESLLSSGEIRMKGSTVMGKIYSSLGKLG